MYSRNDVFIEHMVRRAHDWRSRAIQALGLLAVPLLTALSLGFEAARPFALFVLAGAGWGAWQVFLRQNKEYEYIVTNGELDVDQITARRYRKRLLTADCRGFEILAPATPKYQREMSDPNLIRRVDASSSRQSENRWFAVFQDAEHRRTILFFEPGRRMMDAFRPLIAGKIHQP